MTALELVDALIDQHLNPHRWYVTNETKVDDLKALQAMMQNEQRNLMALRATLHRALWDFSQVADGWNAAAHDLAAAVADAHKQATAMLTDEEKRAEFVRLSQADTSDDLAAELASCDWEGWN